MLAGVGARARAAASCGAAGRTSCSARRLRRRADGVRGVDPSHPGGARPRPTRTSASRTGSRAPFAKRLFLAYPIETRWRAKSRVVGRPIPRVAAGRRRRRRARSSSCRRTAGARRVRRAGRRDGAERARRRHVGRERAGDPASDGQRDYELVKRRVDRARLPRARRDRPLRRRDSPRATSSSRARVGGVGDRGRGHAGDPRPVPVRDRRPPGAERAALRARGRRDHGARARARRRAGARALSARRPAAPAADGRGDAARGQARRGRRDRRRAARARAT